jgi:spermidine/putrescine transport system permease protein
MGKRVRSLFTGFAVLLVYLPMAFVLAFSFNAAPRGLTWAGFTLRWYAEVWHDRDVMSAAGVTLVICLWVTVLSISLGGSLAWAVSSMTSRLGDVVMVTLLVPIVTPDLVVALCQSILYRTAQVPTGVGTIVASHVVWGTAYVALFAVARLNALDYRTYRLAAASLGASPARVVRDCYFPLVRSALIAGGGLVAALSLQDFLFAFFCGGSGATTISVKLYSIVKFGVRPVLCVIYVLFVGSVVAAGSLNETIRRRS